MEGWLCKSVAIFRHGDPLWFKTGDCSETTLVITHASLLVIGSKSIIVKIVGLIIELASHTHASKPQTQM